MDQIIALRDGNGPSNNTLTPSGTSAMHRPSIKNVDSNLVPFRVSKGRKNIEANDTERMRPNMRTVVKLILDLNPLV